jgi:hypothetical protein
VNPLRKFSTLETSMGSTMLRRFLAWALFGAGHAVSKVMDLWPWDRLHPHGLYSRLMLASVCVQGDGPGPWSRP